MNIRQFLQILVLACLPIPALAQPYSSDWQAAMDAASPRLRLFALQHAQPDGAQNTVQEVQRYLGLRHQNTGPLISHSWELAPVAAYDANINGGTPGETIKIGQFIFTLTPESRAKSGLVFGVSPSTKLRFSVAQGTVLDLSASAEFSHSFQHDINKQSYGTALCMGQYLGQSDWLDFCMGQRASVRALGTSREDFASITAARQFSSRFGLHEITARLQNTNHADFSQPTVDFGLTTAQKSVGVLNLRLDGGRYISGEHTRIFGANLSLTRPIFGRRSTVFAGFSREAGGQFFGTPRKDTVYSVGASFPISKKVGLSLSLRKRASTLENYNGTSLGLDLTFTGLRF